MANKDNTGVIAIFVVALLLLFLFNGYVGFGGMRRVMGGGGLYGLGWIVQVLIVVVLLLVIAWFVNQTQGKGRR
ncbi:MAG: hypothetical protein KKD18_02675 [Nanoarchaeota archaeon]|nr:hypothetical protein [Nanoarchaeota archaeon]